MKTKPLVYFTGMKRMEVENDFSWSPFAGHSWNNLKRDFNSSPSLGQWYPYL
jgi:hypothetical protein